MPVDTKGAIQERVDEAVRRLVSGRVTGDRARIALPVLYPSGAGAAVEIIINGDRCFISDFGFGQLEAEMQGADDFYGFAARKASERFGVGFDGASIFATWASLGKLEGAVAAVANASVQAVSNAVMSAVEEKERNNNLELYERVCHIFGASSVAKKQDVSGKDAIWSAHNVVTLPNRRVAIFEFVNEHQNSISNKFMMFSDLSSIEGQSYSLNSIVKSVDRLGKKGAMLADVSHVFEIGAPPAQFLRYAEAA